MYDTNISSSFETQTKSSIGLSAIVDNEEYPYVCYYFSVDVLKIPWSSKFNYQKIVLISKKVLYLKTHKMIVSVLWIWQSFSSNHCI